MNSTWGGHVLRTEESDAAKKIFCTKTGGKMGENTVEVMG